MTQQASLFTSHVTKAGVTERPTTRPLARSGDPAPSHAAAERVVDSGQHASQCRAVLGALLSCATPPTSRELAAAMGIDRYVVARRLPDLADAGLVAKGTNTAGGIVTRQCQVAGTHAVTWRVTDAGVRVIRLGLPLPKPERGRARAA